jgi:hypothetical protein
MTLRKRDVLKIEGGSTRWHCGELAVEEAMEHTRKNNMV